MNRKRIEWTRQPVAAIYSEALRLLSFGISVTRSDPSAMAVPAGWGTADLAVDSGDAFSISYLHNLKGEEVTVDRRYNGMDPAFLRRVLLQIFGGEEYEAVQDHHDARLVGLQIETETSGGEEGVPRSYFVERPEEPEPVAQVRITDVRLAKDLAPKVLQRELKSALPDLPVPVTADGVMRWKHQILRNPKGMRKPAELVEEKWYKEEVDRIESISFAAAALCLFLDLGMANVEEADRDGLAGQVLDLAEMIRELTVSLDKSVDRLSRLLGTGKGGRPPDPDIKYYTALVLYRMGHSPSKIAQRIGLTPIPQKRENLGEDEKAPHGNKNWKNMLRGAMEKGIKVEREKFPIAAEVFTRSKDERVRQQALDLYRGYHQDPSRARLADQISRFDDGDDLLTPRNTDEQRDNALIQLGSCLANRREPLRPTLD